MKHFYLILFVFLSITNFLFGQNERTSSASIQKHFLWVKNELKHANSTKVLVVAHRGDWRNAPENSIQALKNCIEMGVDLMEIDLKMTKDSILVLMHDNTINRTMSGSGNISDYTFTKLQSMTLKGGNGCPTKHKIPTFKEIMECAKGKICINIDKCYPFYHEVYRILKETNTLDQVIINSEKTYEENRIKYGKLLDSIPFKPVVSLDNLSQKNIDIYISIHPKVMELVFSKDTSYYLHHKEIFKQAGIKIFMNAMWSSLSADHTDDQAVELNDPTNSWQWLIEHGATMIQTDRPKQLLQYLRRHQLHM